jgi:hypothetical protein
VGVRQTIHCVLCGWDVAPSRLGLGARGEYDTENAPQHEMGVRLTTFGGRANITVRREPLPLEFAYGLRRALKAALARVEADIAEVGGEAEDDAA